MFIVLLVISCLVPLLKNMNNHNAAFWSASPSTDERSYKNELEFVVFLGGSHFGCSIVARSSEGAYFVIYLW